MLIQERQDHAEESGQVITLLDTPDKTTAVVDVEYTEEVEILPSFEEIRSIMGFSPRNNTSDLVPHDEDLSMTMAMAKKVSSKLFTCMVDDMR